MDDVHPMDLIMSIRPRYSALILNGSKTVELRRRRTIIPHGARVWIYATMPIGRIVGRAIVEEVTVADLSTLWAMTKAGAGIDYQEFLEYFHGLETGCAIHLRHPEPLQRELDLASVRSRLGKFHPPQFFAWLGRDHPLLQELRSLPFAASRAG